MQHRYYAHPCRIKGVLVGHITHLVVNGVELGERILRFPKDVIENAKALGLKTDGASDSKGGVVLIERRGSHDCEVCREKGR